jgi:Xaa-Pro aminopeptidase
VKADLDRLMAKFNLDVIFVLGGEEPNTYRRYLMNGADANGHVIKVRNQEPIAIVNPMEVDEAAPSGLKIYTPYDFGMGELQKQYKGDRGSVQRAYFANIFTQLNLSGRVAFYGTGDVYWAIRLMREVFSSITSIEIVTDFAAAELFEAAYRTKDAAEIVQLKRAAVLSAEVVKATHAFLTSLHGNADGSVVDASQKPVTIGDVKRFIRYQLLERGLENADGMIFAQGRDAGVPHSSGQDAQPLHTGQSIVFDFFPRLTDTGYFHDMTRTWSLGYATPEVQTAYDHVMEVFHLVDDTLKVGDDTSRYQQLTCDVFEKYGHKTPRTNPGTSDGYVHSLGHGVGLNIHEAPHFANYSTDEQIEPGNVITIEPGLYYPDQGFGVRVEDTVYVDEQGIIHTLTDFPYDLVVPLNG